MQELNCLPNQKKYSTFELDEMNEIEEELQRGIRKEWDRNCKGIEEELKIN